MATIVDNCPRCGAQKITFDIYAQQFRKLIYGWKVEYEAYSVCRKCSAGTIFILGAKSSIIQEHYIDMPLSTFEKDITEHYEVDGFISVKDIAVAEPPEFLPEDICKAFNEAARCFSVKAYNGASAMFRLCLDLATKPLLPKTEDQQAVQPNEKQRRDLGLRLAWLFEKQIIPVTFKELAKCVREDANDGAHVGNLTKVDAEDLQEFTYALLERLITEKERIKRAEERRAARREQPIA
jgi:hypothetical protein